MAPQDLLGWVAAGLVLATFCAKRMAALRVIAIASNVAFVGYAYATHLWPILVLHSIMLPINAVRLREALCPAGIFLARHDTACCNGSQRGRADQQPAGSGRLHSDDAAVRRPREV
jgi:hypothetical protein